jgi:hypothetical protein
MSHTSHLAMVLLHQQCSLPPGMHFLHHPIIPAVFQPEGSSRLGMDLAIQIMCSARRAWRRHAATAWGHAGKTDRPLTALCVCGAPMRACKRLHVRGCVNALSGVRALARCASTGASSTNRSHALTNAGSFSVRQPKCASMLETWRRLSVGPYMCRTTIYKSKR